MMMMMVMSVTPRLMVEESEGDVMLHVFPSS